jgi:hypothetical protein
MEARFASTQKSEEEPELTGLSKTALDFFLSFGMQLQPFRKPFSAQLAGGELQDAREDHWSAARLKFARGFRAR